MGKPVVMGRKTYLSIGKPLPGRTNIVVTRDPAFARGRRGRGATVARTLWRLRAATRCGAASDEIAVIGGTEIFAQTMPLADRLVITHVHARPAGDTYFPPIDSTRWRAVARSEHPAGPGTRPLSISSLTGRFKRRNDGKISPSSTLEP